MRATTSTSPTLALAGRLCSSVTSAFGSWLRTVDRLWLGLFVAADLVFIALHIAHKLWYPTWLFLAITHDGGYGEMFQYLKQFWIALMLASAAMRWRDRLLWCWSAAFGYLLLDNALSLHERAGAWLANQGQVAEQFDVPARALGELVFFALIGIIGCVAFAVAVAGDTKRFTLPNRVLLLLFAVLVFFGVGVDLLHSFAQARGWPGCGVIEDGGEMLAMSAITAYAPALARR